MALSSLPLRTTTRLQQIAKIFSQPSHRRIAGIQARTYTKANIDTIMGAQKTDTREGYAQTPLNTIKVYKHRGNLHPSTYFYQTQQTHVLDPSCLRLPNHPLHLRLHPRLPRLLHIHRQRRRPNTHEPPFNRRTRPLRPLPSPALLPYSPTISPSLQLESSLGCLPPRERSNDAPSRNPQERQHQSMHLLHKSRRRSPKLYTQWPFSKLQICCYTWNS